MTTLSRKFANRLRVLSLSQHKELAALSPYVTVIPSPEVKDGVLEIYALKASKALSGNLDSICRAEIGFEPEMSSVYCDFTYSVFQKGGSVKGRPWIETWSLLKLLLKMQAAGFQSSDISLGSDWRKNACVLGFVTKPLKASLLV